MNGWVSLQSRSQNYKDCLTENKENTKRKQTHQKQKQNKQTNKQKTNKQIKQKQKQKQNKNNILNNKTPFTFACI